MARPLRIQFENAFYHIMARGQRKEPIVCDDKDKWEFFSRLKDTIEKYNLNIYAYCLMNNHYHLLAETPNANLSDAMHYFNSSYSSYFKNRYKLAGSVFQGRYKAVSVDKDSYFLTLTAYIHLNPVRAKMVEHPEDYEWSSYQYYIGKKDAPHFLFTNELKDNFNKYEYKNFIEDIMNSGRVFDRKEIYGTNSLLGGESFNAKIIKLTGENRDMEKDYEIPDYRRLKQIDKETIIDTIEKTFNLTRKEIFFKKRGNFYRKLAIYGLKKYTGLKLKEIGLLSGSNYHAVSSAYYAFLSKIQEKREIRKMVEKFDEKIEKQGGRNWKI